MRASSGMASPLQALGVALAVVPLVVIQDAGEQVLDRVEVGQDAVADDDVLLDVLELLVGQRPALGEDVVADADLADVVQQAGEVDVAQLVLLQAELAPELDGRPRHALAVAVGVGVLGVDRGGQRAGQPDQEVLDVQVAAGRRAPAGRSARRTAAAVAASVRRNGRIGGACRRRARRGGWTGASAPRGRPGPRAEPRRLFSARTHPVSFRSATGIASRLRTCGNRAPQLVSRVSLMIT